MSLHPLSQATTPFIGRTTELTSIITRLNDPACRLLTLVGPGGIGKTRLSIEVALQPQIKFVDEPIFVGLQSIASVDKIPQAIVDALDLELIEGKHPKAELLAYLHDREILLVLDNFEHLMSGSDLLTELLAAAPQVKLLITSRERLHLQEEWVFDVTGLALPEGEDSASVEKSSACQLFLECVRRTGYTLQTNDVVPIVRICRLVGGIPLAIELAASWIRTLPCDEIVHEIEHSLDFLTTNIRNVPEKHRSMRAVFEHSWMLLSADQQTVFRKLSVFQGGFRREAAEQVAGASLPILAGLVDQSLLRVDANGRYSLHELLRQFSTEKLDTSPEETTQTHDLHCHYYTDFMGKQWSRLSGSEIKSALTDITTELDNVRAAWNWAIEHHKTSEIEMALHSLWFYHGVSTRFREGREVFARAVPVFSDSTALHGKLMAHWAELLWLFASPNDLNEAYLLMEQSLRLLRQVDERAYIAFALYRIALMGLRSPIQVPNMSQILEESLAIYTELGDSFGMGEVLTVQSQFHVNQYIEQKQDSSLLEAQQCCQKALIAYQQTQSLFGIVIVYEQYSRIAIEQIDYRQGLQYAQTCLKFHQNLSIPWGITIALSLVQYTAYKLGDYAETRRAILENLRKHIEYRFHLYGVSVLRSLNLLAAMHVTEGEQVRAHELLGFVAWQLSNLQITPDSDYYFSLALLDKDLPPQLAEAVERGRKRDLESVVKEVVVNLTNWLSTTVEVTESDNSVLTDRETEIIQLIADGLNTREIAAKIHLSVTTVRWYMRQIYSKLDVHSRAELIAHARKMNLLA
jgi:predicted ATPase/DNA-binding CsgD family transcriptional regulator